MPSMRYHAFALILGLLCSCERAQQPILLASPPQWTKLRRVDCGSNMVLKEAVSWWQKNTCGEAVFCADSYPSIFVEYDRPPSQALAPVSEHADAAAYFDPHAERGYIYTWGFHEINVEFEVLAHEIGHLLGLADDPGSRLSVMAAPDGSFPTLLGERDKRAVITRFCNGTAILGGRP